MSRPRALLLTGLLAALVLSGCASLPDRGQVQAGAAPAASGRPAPFDFNPPGPLPGASRTQVVIGFLRALQATPVSTRVATEFLASSATDDWHPDRATIVYGGQRTVAVTDHVTLALDGAFELDRTGRWAGEASSRPATERGRVMRLHLEREDGEWRITDPPDAMIIPRSHFEARYREYSLYFFDPTGSLLVPEPVYLPTGVQAPTLLMSGLLRGPARGPSVERTYIPADTRLGVSVPVRGDGVAEVPLSQEIRDLGQDQLDLALAQISWTLRQVDGVQAMRLTVDAVPVDLPGGGDLAGVNGWTEFSPTVAAASTDLFGLREGSVVEVVGDQEVVMSPIADTAIGEPRSLGVSMLAQHYGVVSEGGTRAEVLTRSGAGEATDTIAGTDLLRPMWDRNDRMWLLDRTSGGTVVTTVLDGRTTVLPAPALDGVRVQAASLSRDGSRLVVAVPRGGQGGSRLVRLDVERRGSGVPVRLTSPLRLGTPDPLSTVVALGWRDPTTVAALTRPSRSTSQVVLVAIDGSSASVALEESVDLLFEAGVGLAASPGGRTALMVTTKDGSLHALNAQGRWDFDVAAPGLRAATFVG